jgi:hypothetical protein
MATVNLGRIKPVFKGAYAGGTAYVVDDIVTSGNETFICILASTGNATSNATYWTKLASKGADGSNGSNGTDVGTTITTQGDILYRDGSGLQRLGAGTSGQVLQTGGTGANPSWINAPSGVVKNIVYAYDTTQRSTTSGSAVTAGNTLGVTLTPASASSLVYVSFDFSGGIHANQDRFNAHIFRNNTDLGVIRSQEMRAGSSYSSETPMTINYIDTGNTGSITYTLRISASGHTGYINGGGVSKGIGMAIEYVL